jgi:hypothetical protein
MGAQTEALLKLVLCAGAVAVLARRHLRPGRLGADQAGRWLVLAAVVAALAYTNFGRFQGWPPLHTRELFHYFLGSKYYPELKHDGLYVASVAAQFQSHPELAVQPYLRDLRTKRVAALGALEGHAQRVRERFSDARWQQFVTDHDYFVTPQDHYRLTWFRLDHGYNPSPTWSFVARLFSRWLPAGDAPFLFLASLDFFLLGAMCFGIYRVYGGRVAAMVVLLLGLGAPWRYDWVGGAFLRADWIAATGLGICALRRERFVLAGALIGYAAMIRVFPAAFLVGPAVVALREWTQGSPPRWLLRLAAGALAAVAVGGLAGSLTGSGLATWPEFLENMRVYRERLPANGIGLKHAILLDRVATLPEQMGASLQESETRRDAALARAEQERRPWYLAASALLIAITLAAMWKRTPDEAALLGSALLFGALSMACYYWIVLALVPLAGALWLPTASVLAISALVFAITWISSEQLAVTYGAASWALLLFFAVWLVRSAIRAPDGPSATPPASRSPRPARPAARSARRPAGSAASDARRSDRSRRSLPW